jgi:hypothetical protein
MLLQSHAGEIHLLPALPKAWYEGSFRGLRARGGVEVDLTWRDGRAVSAVLKTSLADGSDSARRRGTRWCRRPPMGVMYRFGWRMKS